MTLDASTPPLPVPDEWTAFFWEGVQRGELRIQRCQDCRHYIHYPRPICRFCQSRSLRGEPVSGRARLHSWTIANQPFHPYWVERAPYTIGTVELVEQPGLMFASQIVGCEEEDLRAGLSLEVVFERLTSELVVPFFRPVRMDGEAAR